MGITVFISLYTTRLILNALGASDFGIFNIVGGAIAMLGFLNAAMASATQRFMSYAEGEGNKEKQKTIFNISFVLHLFIALIFIVVLIIAGYFFFNGILNIEKNRIFAAKIVYASLIVSTAFTVMTVPYDAVMNARENMLYYAIVGIIESVLKLCVALAVVFFTGDKLILYGILMAGIPIVIMTIMRIYCHKNYDECVIAPKKYWDAKLMNEMRSFAGWNLVGISGSMITNYGRNIVGNSFFGTPLNAALAIVAQLNGQILAVSNNLLKAVNPIIVKNEGLGKREDMLSVSLTTCKISFFLYSIFAIPLFVNTQIIFMLWLKHVPIYAVILFKIFIFQVIIEQVSLPLGTILSAIGKIKGYNILSTVIMFFSLIVMYVLFSIGFEPYSFMYVSLISAFLILLIKVKFCNEFSNLSIASYSKQIFLPSVVIFITGLILVSFIINKIQGDIYKLIFSTLTSLIYLVISSYFMLFNTIERKTVTKIISKIKF